MLKLPNCPYCGCKLDYRYVRKHIHEKTTECRGCRKLMAVSYKKSVAVMAVLFFVALIVLNTVYLKFTKSLTIYPNVIFTVLFIVLFIILVPLRVQYYKIPGQEPVEKLKKNRHRHKKTKNQRIDIDDNPLKGTSFDE